MRNPFRNTLLWLALSIVGPFLAQHGDALTRGKPLALDLDHLIGVPLLLCGAFILFGPIFFVRALIATLGYRKLMAGRGVIARWHLSPAVWERFRALDVQRERAFNWNWFPRFSPINDFTVQKGAREAGVEVIVGERSLIVDGSWHPLHPNGHPALRAIRWLTSDPECIEFSVAYLRGKYASQTMTQPLRVPVAPDQRQAAAMAFRHFEALIRSGGFMADPRKALRVGLALLAAGALTLTALFMPVALPAWMKDGMGSVIVVWLFILGAFGTLAGFILLLACAKEALARRPSHSRVSGWRIFWSLLALALSVAAVGIWQYRSGAQGNLPVALAISGLMSAIAILIVGGVALRGEKLGTRFTDPVLRRRAIGARAVLGVAMAATILFFAADGRFTPSDMRRASRASGPPPREIVWNETPGRYVFAVALEIVIAVPLALVLLSPLVSAFVERSGTRRTRERNWTR